MSTVDSAATKPLLTAVFDDGNAAERAYEACLDRGYGIDDFNVVISEGTRKKLLSDHSEVKTELARRKAEGGELGGPSGGRVGILVTVLAAVGAAVAVPTIGVVAGPIAVALAAAGAAGVAAGLIGALGDWGIPAERIHGYEAAIRKGAILVMVATRSDADAREVGEIWKKLGGRDIHNR